MNIISLQVIAVLIQVYIANTKKVVNVMLATFLFNVLTMLCYLYIDDITTVYMYILIIIRSFIYIFKDKLEKYNFIPLGFIIIQLVVGFITIENFFNIISILVPCYTIYYMWYYKTTQKLRVGNIISNGLWGVYNAIIGLYIIMVARIITVIVNIIVYVKNMRGSEA